MINMIISGKQIQNAAKIYGEQTKVSKTVKANKASLAQKPDEVILSSQAQEMGAIYQSIRSLPEVREDRVKELSSQIDSGTYNVSGQDIADKMIGRTLADQLR